MIGSRTSRLALFQANQVLDKLAAHYPDILFEVQGIKTEGDSGVVGKDIGPGDIAPGVFTRRISEALSRGSVDLAVHSAKDMPTRFLPGLAIGAVLERENPCEAWIAGNGMQFRDIPSGFRIGTSSPRRKAQVLSARPDLAIVPVRGNVGTRLKKMTEGEVDGLILASCGLSRLGLRDRVTELLDKDLFLPAVGQGAVAVEVRADDAEMPELVLAVNHEGSFFQITAERAMLAMLEGGCRVPVGVTSAIENGTLLMKAAVYSLDGKETVRAEVRKEAKEARKAGEELAVLLLEKGAGKILKGIRNEE